MLTHVADYLLAARTVLLAGGDVAAHSSDTATRHSLDPSMVQAWCLELKRAVTEPSHPLHLFAQIATEESSHPKASFSSTAEKLFNASRAGEPQAGASSMDQVILDFDAPAPAGTWYSDGVAFGLNPVRVGQILTGSRSDQPLEGIADRSMARRDPLYKDLKPTPGNEADVGLLGEWHRSGQSIRTQTVTLKNGKLWYLVRGAGRAYAVVDSHLVILGPLHGACFSSGTRARMQNGAGLLRICRLMRENDAISSSVRLMMVRWRFPR